MSDCPKCGSTVVYQGLGAVECEGQGCENNPRPHIYVDPYTLHFLKMPVTYDTSGSMSYGTFKAIAEDIKQVVFPKGSVARKFLDHFKESLDDIQE